METASRTRTPPRIWLLVGEKLGDNAQVTMIANALGLPYDVKRLYPKAAFTLKKPRFRVSLDHMDRDRSDRLAQPWPDLVITSGRRHAMAALWIKQQCPRTKIVLLGRPRRWIEAFDLVITPPQYQVPELPNVVHLALPLMRTDAAAVAKAAQIWQSRLDTLPKPLIAVLVGGATRPFRFDAEVTRDLVARCAELQTGCNGTLYFTTSRRTSAEIARTLREQLPTTARLYDWQRDQDANPYLGLLAVADCFVVTGDSISMMIEVADRQKPLAIYPLPSDRRGRFWQSVTHRLHPRNENRRADTLFSRIGRLLYRAGVVGYARDLTRIHDTLIAGGFAVRLGAAFNTPSAALPDELGRIRQRVLSLLG